MAISQYLSFLFTYNNMGMQLYNSYLEKFGFNLEYMSLISVYEIKEKL